MKQIKIQQIDNEIEENIKLLTKTLVMETYTKDERVKLTSLTLVNNMDLAKERELLR